jgi:hypothetical protein
VKKALVSLLWIAVLNGAFLELPAEYSVRFIPTITRQELYDYGATFGFGFFVISAVLIVYLAVTNRLLGVRQRPPNDAE